MKFARGMIGLSLAMGWLAASAQEGYPTRPITLVVPIGPGGAIDVIARPIAERLSLKLKQPVILDYKPGAGGLLATRSVLAAPADGYTVLWQLTGMVQNPWLYKNIPYDPIRDFVPVGQVCTAAIALTVGVGKPYGSVDALVRHAEQNAASFSWGSSGVGGTGHIYTQVFQQQRGLSSPIAPYKGEVPLQLDLISGRLDAAFLTTGLALRLRNEGRARVLAVTGTKRFSQLADVSTFSELGDKSLDLTGWFGVFVRSATPAAVLSRLQSELQAVLKDPEVTQRIRDQAFEPSEISAAEFKAQIDRDYTVWGDVIRKVGAQLE